MKRLVWVVIIVVVLLALAIAAVTLHTVNASRLDAHSRSIDIDICIHCTQPGPPGPQGPPGEQGPPGPPGPDKELHVKQVLSDVVTISAEPPNNEVTISAECAGDEVVIGGGYSTSYWGGVIQGNDGTNSWVTESQVDNGWSINYINRAGNPVNIQAFAECAKLVDAP